MRIKRNARGNEVKKAALPSCNFSNAKDSIIVIITVTTVSVPGILSWPKPLKIRALVHSAYLTYTLEHISKYIRAHMNMYYIDLLLCTCARFYCLCAFDFSAALHIFTAQCTYYKLSTISVPVYVCLYASFILEWDYISIFVLFKRGEIFQNIRHRLRHLNI